MSTSRNDYLPRWSSQLTEQLLSYKSGTPSPSSPPNDSGTASVVMPNQESGKQKAPVQHHQNQQNPPATPFDSTTQRQHHDNHHIYSIPELWSQLSQQIPSSSPQQSKKKMGRVSPSTAPEIEKHGDVSSPSRQHHQNSWAEENDVIIDDAGRWPLGLFLFWFGFLCPLLWWVGAFWPRHADRYGKMAHRWQWINRIMSITFCIFLFLLLLSVGIWYHFSSP
ncbi:hypothetical protein BCR42DRAFT_409981 [Absidia repens]|uniref:Uncharacterized protein n=1 Tax=Absidia repens TaxID=90262 RepID=A0A1X2INF4_9FUNG|nr:hypothetical protein BCR42DRAFT_409981 [Absidia repens]